MGTHSERNVRGQRGSAQRECLANAEVRNANAMDKLTRGGTRQRSGRLTVASNTAWLGPTRPENGRDAGGTQLRQTPI
eukprot:8686168-Lingulodinium_polyedra.AAC.1